MHGTATTGPCPWAGVSDMGAVLWPSETANDMMLAIIDAHQSGEPLCQRETCEFDGHCSTRTRMGRGQILDRLVRDGMVRRVSGPGVKILSVPTEAGLHAWRLPLPTDNTAWKLMTVDSSTVTVGQVNALGRQLRSLWRTHYEIGVRALRELAPLGDWKAGQYVAHLWRHRDAAMVEAVLDVEGLTPSQVRKLLACS